MNVIRMKTAMNGMSGVRAYLEFRSSCPSQNPHGREASIHRKKILRTSCEAHLIHQRCMRERKTYTCEEFIVLNNSSDLLTHQSLHKRTEILYIWSVIDLSGFSREPDATLYILGMNAFFLGGGRGAGSNIYIFFCPAAWHARS